MSSDPLTDLRPANDLMPRQTRRSLPIALLRAREAVMGKFRPMLAEHDINEQQWRVIRVLCESGELDATELAERAMILAPSLTRMLKALKARKLVVVRKDRADGRRTLISNTPAARALIDKVTPESTAIYRDLEQSLGRPEMERLLDLLESVARL